MIERTEIDDVVVLRLAHGKVNALDLELLERLTEILTELQGQPPRGVVLTGTGGAFSAGVDLWRIVDGGPAYIEAFLPALSAAFLAAFNLPQPLVAAVNGHAIAGGCVLAACADHRVMGGRGTIGVTELLVGVPFPTTALTILEYALGPAQTRACVVGGATFEPAQALERGLVDELDDDPVSAAVAVARRMATAVPADTYAFTKHQLRRSVNETVQMRRDLEDPRVLEQWTARLADGGIERFMKAKGSASRRS
ncbi:enoyl-CoA hydratase/isomerase family protein [Nonomuraea soli]|uniref:Enoyl-CoA hydratase n=1 Tax=Nonomuraea soli TaxID=1032476 RepID=A0A7W0CH36_9ACTN|nr:enoyl-CoA hydratase/isomerase family protein [Nonomuraea soli]MBA2890882.1 enoyl-CoA hydratase [Nonomuraea soli]